MRYFRINFATATHAAKFAEDHALNAWCIYGEGNWNIYVKTDMYLTNAEHQLYASYYVGKYAISEYQEITQAEFEFHKSKLTEAMLKDLLTYRPERRSPL